MNVFEVLALSLGHLLWQGALMGMVAAAGLWLLRRPEWRYLWLVFHLVVLSLCLPTTAIWLSAASIVGREAAMPFVVAPPLWEVAPGGGSPMRSWAEAVVWAWLGGVALLNLRLLLGLLGLARLRRSLQAAPEEWHQVLHRFAAMLGLRRDPLLRVSPRLREPLVLWWGRPIVVVPLAWVLEVPPAVLESVLVHELAHVRRRDLWVIGFQRVVEALLFYHPVVWWLSARISWERELCCDALVVRRLGRPLEYAQALEYVAHTSRKAQRSVLTATLGGPRMALLQRIRRVLGLPLERETRGTWWAGAATMALVSLGVVAAVQSQQPPQQPRFRDLEQATAPAAEIVPARRRGQADSESAPASDAAMAVRRGLESQVNRELQALDAELDAHRQRIEQRRRELLREMEIQQHNLRQQAVQERDRAIAAEERTIRDVARRSQPGRAADSFGHAPGHHSDADEFGPKNRDRMPPQNRRHEEPFDVAADEPNMELMNVVRQLQDELGQLRREVNELRSSRTPVAVPREQFRREAPAATRQLNDDELLQALKDLLSQRAAAERPKPAHVRPMPVPALSDELPTFPSPTPPSLQPPAAPVPLTRNPALDPFSAQPQTQAPSSPTPTLPAPPTFDLAPGAPEPAAKPTEPPKPAEPSKPADPATPPGFNRT